MSFQKKSIFYIVLFYCLITLLIGCAKKIDTKDTPVYIWHWMSDRHDTFKQLADKYFEETNEKVIFELNAPSDLYTFKVRAAAQTNTLPDVFGVLGGTNDLANFIKASLVHSLTDYMNENNGEWKKTFSPKALTMTSFEEGNQWNILQGNYGVPIDLSNMQMIFNEQIFKDAGIVQIPKTWEDFIKAGETITKKFKGIKYFSAGFGETWIINTMVQNFAINLIGKENYLKTLKGELSYNTENWINVFSKFKELADKKLLISGIVTTINKNAERIFVTGKSAVIYNGSWSLNVYKGMNPSLKCGVMFFPAISDNYPVVIHGGAGSSFLVSEQSTKKDKVIKFLKWLTNKDNQSILAKETNNLPANINALNQISGTLKEFADDMDATINPSNFPYIEDPLIEETIGRGIQSLIIGETTPQKLVKEIAMQKEKILKASKDK